MKELNQQIEKVYKQMIRKKELECEIELITKELEVLAHQSYALKEEMEKEERDVKELEGRSFAALMGRLSGKLEEQLEKEGREFSIARNAYEKNTREYAIGEQALETIRMELKEYENIENLFAELIDRKRVLLTSLQKEPLELLEKETEISQLENLILILGECQESAAVTKDIAADFSDTIGAAVAWKAITYSSVLEVFQNTGINSELKKIPLLHASIKKHKQQLERVPVITVFPEMNEILNDLKNLDSEYIEKILDLNMISGEEYVGTADKKMKELHLKLYTSVKKLEDMQNRLKEELIVQEGKWQKLVMQA